MVVIEFVSPSSVIQEPLRLKVEKVKTISDIKTLIKEKHADNPPQDA